MDAPVVIDNRCGTVRGYAQDAAVFLAVNADTPKYGPVTTAFKLSGPMQLIYFYSVLLNLEMQFFSLIARRGESSGFTLLADLTADGAPTPVPSPVRSTMEGDARLRPAPTNRRPRAERRAALFEGELTAFRTQSAGGRAGVEIRCKLDVNSMRYRVFFSVLNFETRAIARFDLNVGEIRALKTLAEQSLARVERLEIRLLDDPHTLSATLVAAGSALEFGLQTPYTHRRLAFRDAHNLATLAFWCERALVQRGNPLISFKRESLGMALWEHRDSLLPYARFYLGGTDAEILNLTRLNLCAIKLFAELALRRAVCRSTPEIERTGEVQMAPGALR